MPDNRLPRIIAETPVQLALNQTTPAQTRGRLFKSLKNLRPPASGHAAIRAINFTGAEINRQIDLHYQAGRSEQIAGFTPIFSSQDQEATRNILPMLKAPTNSLPDGAVQLPYSHSSVAVSLVIQGDRCFSIIDGRRKA